MILLKVNHVRNLSQHVSMMITSQRPSFECKAVNSDHASMTQAQLAQGILDYDMREKRLEAVAKQVVDSAVQYGEGWGTKLWDATGGDDYAVDPDTQQPVKTGTLRFQSYTPDNVVRDFTQDDPKRNDWIVLRRWVNKYTLMAKYPELADKIDACPSKFQAMVQHPTLQLDKSTTGLEYSDEIELFDFFHEKTDALPDGRRVSLVSADCILDDGALPYRKMPGYRMSAGTQFNVSFGYSATFDLLSIQHAVNSLYATVATNQAAFGVQNILVPKGHAISTKQLPGGLQTITYDPKIGEPKALNLTQTAPETFKFLEILEHDMETLSGVNSVARGNPEASLKSGSALAMVASQALQFAVGLQQSYVEWLEDICTGAIMDYRDFADMPQIAMIAGKASRSDMKEFTGKDLDRINRVVVDIGNPLSRTLAGRSEIAQQLVQAGLVKTPEQYIEVITTGRLEPVIEGTQRELMNIRSENERLSAGSPCQAVITDDHPTHIKEHKVVLASPEAREDQNLTAMALAHIQEHLDQLRSADPLMLQVLGIPVPPDNHGAPTPPQAPPGQGGPGGPGGPPGGPTAGPMGPPASQGPTGPANPVADMPKPPQLPLNPLTGAREPSPVMPGGGTIPGVRQ
jgi:hypothetical protein